AAKNPIPRNWPAKRVGRFNDSRPISTLNTGSMSKGSYSIAKTSNSSRASRTWTAFIYCTPVWSQYDVPKSRGLLSIEELHADPPDLSLASIPGSQSCAAVFYLLLALRQASH